jgi:hypothetical protein
MQRELIKILLDGQRATRGWSHGLFKGPLATRTAERYRVKVVPAHIRGRTRPSASGFGPHLASGCLQTAMGLTWQANCF